MQRIEDLRRAKAAGPAGTEEPTDDLAASARAAVSDPDVNMPAIQLPKKRKASAGGVLFWSCVKDMWGIDKPSVRAFWCVWQGVGKA